MGKFKKTIIVEAVQWTGHNFDELKAFCGCVERTGNHHCTGDVTIPMSDRFGVILVGEWIVKNVNGDHHSCDDDYFKRTYESTEE